MKKLVAIIIAVLMITSILAACGSSGGSTEKTSETSAAEQTTTTVNETTTVNTEGNKDADISDDESLGSVEKQLGEMSQKTAPGEYYGDLIKIACTNGANTWDPFARGGGFGVQVSVFEKLGQADNEGHLKLCMLKSINKKDDVTYECELWDFIKDTEGNNITASDVAWSIQQFIDSGNQGGVAKLDSIEVTGDYTFIWHNSAPFAIGEMEKQMSNPSILSQAAYEADPDHMAANPIGTGPYKLKEFMEGSYVLYEVNEDYWYNNIDDEKWLEENDFVWSYQNFKEIRCDIISDASARAIALENGSVDACTQMNITDVSAYKDNPDFTTINLPVNPPVAFYFNISDGSLCNDINLRKAICYAVDNEAVAAGLDVPAYPVYGIQPRMYDAPENWTTGEGRDYYDHDIEKAKEYLEQSSYNGEPIRMIFSDQDQNVPAFTLVQAQLKEVGINLEMTTLEKSAMDALKYDFSGWEMLSDMMGGGNYLANTLKKFWSQDVFKSLNGFNVCGVEDPQLDKLYEDVLNIGGDASVEAWDQYFTYDMCYGYAICCYANQTACSSKYIASIFGSQSQLVPGAFTLAE